MLRPVSDALTPKAGLKPNNQTQLSSWLVQTQLLTIIPPKPKLTLTFFPTE